MGWLNLQIQRYKAWRGFRRVCRAWREKTGGSCRYKFHLGGSCMSFSAPEIKTPEDATRLLREVADLIAAFPGAEVVVGGGE
jgi:hypothetical protein